MILPQLDCDPVSVRRVLIIDALILVCDQKAVCIQLLLEILLSVQQTCHFFFIVTRQFAAPPIAGYKTPSIAN